MPHIHNGPGEHDLTASAFIVRTDLVEPKIMLHRHRLLGVWMQFGGHVELNENLWQALGREIPEESGYDLDQLQVLQPPERIRRLPSCQLHPVPVSTLSHPFEGLEGHHHTDYAVAFVANHPPRNPIAAGESAEISAFNAEQLIRMRNIYPNVLQIAQFALKTCLPNWERVDPNQFN